MAINAALEALLNSPATSRALARHYDSVIRRIVGELVAGVSKAQAFRAEALLKRLRALLKELDPQADAFVRKWIRTQLPKVYVLGDDQATAALKAQLRQIGRSGVKGLEPGDASFAALNATSLRGIVAAMEGTLGRAKDSIESALGTVVRQTQVSLAKSAALRDASVSGFIRGATQQQVADDIASILLGKRISPEVRARLEATGFNAKLFADFEAVARGTLIKVGKVRMSVRHYANLVANVQMREAHKIATLVRCQANRIPHVQISRHQQDHPDECTPYAGRVFYIGEGQDPAGFPDLRSIPSLPFHPFCAPAGTMISTIAGPVAIEDICLDDFVLTHRGRFRRVTHLVRRDYSGAMVHLDNLCLTPNHPVLTDRGWIPAGELCGCANAGDEKSGVAAAGMRDANDQPSEGGESRVSDLALSAPVGPSVVLPFDLDVHLRLGEGDVGAVDADGKLEFEGETETAQLVAGHPLEARRVPPPVIGHAPRHPLSDGLDCAGVPALHAGDIPAECAGVGVGDTAGQVSADPGPRRDAEPAEQSKDVRSAGVVVSHLGAQIGERCSRFVAAAKVFLKRLAESLLGIGEESRHPNCGHALVCHSARGLVKARLGISLFSGTVYNFSVDEDESYVAEGIVVHNCRHVLKPYVVVAKDQSDVEEALKDARGLPDEFRTQDVKTIRRTVAGLSAAQLKKVAPSGAADVGAA